MLGGNGFNYESGSDSDTEIDIQESKKTSLEDMRKMLESGIRLPIVCIKKLNRDLIKSRDLQLLDMMVKYDLMTSDIILKMINDDCADIFEHLIKNYDLNIYHICGFDALSKAITCKDTKIISLLIEKYSEVINCTDSLNYEKNIMHMILMNHRYDIYYEIHELLSHLMDQCDDNGDLPIKELIKYKMMVFNKYSVNISIPDIINIIDNYLKQDYDDKTKMNRTENLKYLFMLDLPEEMVMQMIEFICPDSKMINRIFHMMINERSDMNIEVIRSVIDRYHPNLDTSNKTRNGRNHYYYHNDNLSALESAVYHGKMDLIKLLEEYGVTITSNILFYCTNYETFMYLYKKYDLDINIYDDDGLLLMARAMSALGIRVKQILILPELDVTKPIMDPDVTQISNNNGYNTGGTLLHFFIDNANFYQNEKLEIIKILIAKGIDLYARDHIGNIFYHYIVDYTIIKELDRLGIDLSLVDGNGDHLFNQEFFFNLIKEHNRIFSEMVNMAVNKHKLDTEDMIRHIRFNLSVIMSLAENRIISRKVSSNDGDDDIFNNDSYHESHDNYDTDSENATNDDRYMKIKEFYHDDPCQANYIIENIKYLDKTFDIDIMSDL